MNPSHRSIRQRALAAAAAVLVLVAGTACTTSEQSTGTSQATATGTVAESSDAAGTTQGAVTEDSTEPTEGSAEATEASSAADPTGATEPGTTEPDSAASESSGTGEASTSVPPATASTPAPETTATSLAFPDQPAVVAAAKASVDQVVQLHALAVSAGQPDRIPAEVIPSSAARIADTLEQQVTMLLALAPAADSEQAKLADTLDTYQDLATQLAEWDPAAGEPLDKAYFTELAKNDKAWLAAMKALGTATGEDLTAGMPELLLPTS